MNLTKYVGEQKRKSIELRKLATETKDFKKYGGQMKFEEGMFEQLNYLIRDRNSFIGSDEELNVIYRKDIEALKQVMNGYKEFKLELSGYRNAILNNKEMLGLKEQVQQRDNIINKAKEFVYDYKKQWTLNDDVVDDMNELLEILNIDKGE